MNIRNITEIPSRFDEALQLFWGYWGQGEKDKQFYIECMKHTSPIDGELVGTYALLRNDINSRQDLFPWFACLYVKESYRNRGIASTLLQHGVEQAKERGFNSIYLESNLVNFYERFGFQTIGTTHDPFGEHANIYVKQIEK